MAQNGDLEQLLQDGIAAARRGDRATGRKLLQQVISQDSDNEIAWIWLASCLTTLNERKQALERVLQINPDNERARQALNALGAGSNMDRQTIDRLRRTTEGTPRQQAGRSRGGGGINLTTIIYGLMVLVIIGGVIFLIITLPDLLDDEPPEPTSAPQVAEAESPTPRIVTPTLPPPPTNTPQPYQGTSLAPTLPPTFTPTATPTATETPLPTNTPYPQREFSLFFTSLGEGESVPALYRMRGDGSEMTQVAPDVRDPAISPSGEQIAFVRDVTAPNPETDEAETLPELFIAPINDLGAAQQITEIRSETLSGPTWSPEGQELLFVSDFDGDEDIWYIQANGENLRKLTTHDGIDREPEWRPQLESREYVFASDRRSVGTTEIYQGFVAQPGVEAPITQLTDAVNSSYAPSWNANGTRLTFLSDRQGDADVYVMGADGSDQRLMTRSDSSAEDRSPQFSPNGQFIAFASNRQDDRFQVYLIETNERSLTRLTQEERNAISLAYVPELIFRLQE